MAYFPLRALGLLVLVLAITVPSCQAVFPRTPTDNAPEVLSPGSFEESR